MIIEVLIGQKARIKPVVGITFLNRSLVALRTDDEEFYFCFLPFELFCGLDFDKKVPFALVEVDFFGVDFDAVFLAEGGRGGELLRVGLVELDWNVVKGFILFWCRCRRRCWCWCGCGIGCSLVFRGFRLLGIWCRRGCWIGRSLVFRGFRLFGICDILGRLLSRTE